MIVVLAGGIGAARFLEGVVQVWPADEVVVVSNTGDDVELYGLHVSPDIDSVIYTLSNVVDHEKSWGVANETFHCLQALERFGHESWFQLGDQDIATHLERTRLLRAGRTLTEATASIARAFSLSLTLLPMSDRPVRTEVETPAGWLPFQEYFVKRRASDDVLSVRFNGIDDATPAPGVLDAIDQADAVLIAPSNPIVSIGPMLELTGVRDRLRSARTRTVAISPIVGGSTIKGPADRMLRGLGHEVSAVGVARLYADLAGAFVIDDVDRDLAPRVEGLGVHALVTDTIMRDAETKRALAAFALQAVGVSR